MTNDDGLDAQLPISKDGLLAALDTAINQAQTLIRHSSYIPDSRDFIAELDAHIQYLRLLADNISEDRCNNYAPVVRKRFKHDETII